MAIESLEQEVERLRAEVDAHRQRELAEFKAALESARRDAEHYRAEAQRNAELGRQIAAEYQLQVNDLRAKLEAKTLSQYDARRDFTRSS